jgi:hypothetical protein
VEDFLEKIARLIGERARSVENARSPKKTGASAFGPLSLQSLLARPVCSKVVQGNSLGCVSKESLTSADIWLNFVGCTVCCGPPRVGYNILVFSTESDPRLWRGFPASFGREISAFA